MAVLTSVFPREAFSYEGLKTETSCYWFSSGVADTTLVSLDRCGSNVRCHTGNTDLPEITSLALTLGLPEGTGVGLGNNSAVAFM